MAGTDFLIALRHGIDGVRHAECDIDGKFTRQPGMHIRYHATLGLGLRGL